MVDVRLIIVASGRCVWNDLQTLYPDIGELEELPDHVMCINDMIMHFPFEINHCFSCDGPMLKKWWAARRPPYKARTTIIPRFHTVKGMGGGGVEEWDWSGQGTSGLGACFVAEQLGYKKIILAGVPMDNSGHYWEAPWGKTNFQREIAYPNGRIRGDGRKYWLNAKSKFKADVKSLSGCTRDLLGHPA